MQRSIISVIVCLLILASYMFLNSSYFHTEQLAWTGLQYLAEDELFAHTSFSPQNVMRVDTKAMANQLVEHPWVRSVEVHWGWPNKLLVEVVERRPLAMVPINESWFLLDEDGLLMPPPLGIHLHSLPLVTQINPESREELAQTARLLVSIPLELIEFISEWNGVERILITRQGTHILLGESRELEAKFKLLQLILDDLASQGLVARRIDLRVVQSPVVTYE